MTGLIVYGGNELAEKDTLPKARNVSLSGSLSVFAQAYRVNGREARRDKFTWRISGNPTLKAGDFQLPLHFLVGSYQDALKQPFNKIGISPSYRWLTVHLGYNSVDFSKLVVSQRTFLGAGIELNPSIVRLGFIYGRWQKAVNPGTFAMPRDT
ncbi:MAG TPA: hypothetical protein VNJ07_08110, partial [Chitinophagales bacterium]|nr:hypothetical protein [Chitinophagales bacterium]